MLRLPLFIHGGIIDAIGFQVVHDFSKVNIRSLLLGHPDGERQVDDRPGLFCCWFRLVELGSVCVWYVCQVAHVADVLLFPFLAKLNLRLKLLVRSECFFQCIDLHRGTRCFEVVVGCCAGGRPPAEEICHGVHLALAMLGDKLELAEAQDPVGSPRRPV